MNKEIDVTTSTFKADVLKEKYNKIIVTGLVLPKDKISRNGVLYDWESAKNTVDKIPGLPMMWNHSVEGLEKPVGHYTDAICLEKRPEFGKWQKVWDETAETLKTPEGIPGLYYEADVNPNGEYADSIVRGDVRKVSIQVVPSKQESETDEDTGESYTRAYIKDYVEISSVPAPGFMETNMAVMCESFNVHKVKKESLQEAKFKVGDNVKVVSKNTPHDGMVGKIIKDEGNGVFDVHFGAKGSWAYDVEELKKESLQEAQKPVDILNDLENGQLTARDALVRLKPFLKESLQEAIKPGDKVHSPSGYAKVIKVVGNKVTVRSNDPAGDFEYDIKQVQKESFRDKSDALAWANKMKKQGWNDKRIEDKISSEFEDPDDVDYVMGNVESFNKMKDSNNVVYNVTKSIDKAISAAKEVDDKELVNKLTRLENDWIGLVRNYKENLFEAYKVINSKKTRGGKYKIELLVDEDGYYIVREYANNSLKSEFDVGNNKQQAIKKYNGMIEDSANIDGKYYESFENLFEACSNEDAEDLMKELIDPLPENEADPKELEIGVKIEMEHTNDKDEAKKIALQHLAEVTDYYSKLNKYVEVWSPDQFPKDIWNKSQSMTVRDQDEFLKKYANTHGIEPEGMDTSNTPTPTKLAGREEKLIKSLNEAEALKMLSEIQ